MIEAGGEFAKAHRYRDPIGDVVGHYAIEQSVEVTLSHGLRPRPFCGDLDVPEVFAHKGPHAIF